jgi:hypothetical protein
VEGTQKNTMTPEASHAALIEELRKRARDPRQQERHQDDWDRPDGSGDVIPVEVIRMQILEIANKSLTSPLDSRGKIEASQKLFTELPEELKIELTVCFILITLLEIAREKC